MKANLVGQVFGRLVVIRCSGKNEKNRQLWECKCNCGNLHIVSTTLLKSGKCKSCGCLRIEKSKKLNTTHGLSNNKNNKYTSEYAIWLGMKARCYNEKNNRYIDWGGRGIIICDSWLNSFENFYFDMGKKPSKNHSIDRIDFNGNYEPSNCRWATQQEQNRNTRTNVFLTYNGETKILTDWSLELGVSRSTIMKRIKKISFTELVNYYKNKKSGKWYIKRQQRFLAATGS